MIGRREFLRLGATGAAVLAAGCTGDGEDAAGAAGDVTATDGGTDTPTGTPTASTERTRSPTTTLSSSDGGATPSSTPPGTPHDLGAVHAHGTIEVRILGDRVDLSRREYQLQDRYFHLEGGNGRVWHLHGEGVTLAYAMDTLGIGVTEDSVTYQGTTYEDGSEYEVRVAVGGREVDPAAYVLEGSPRTPRGRRTSSGSHILIAVRSR